LSSYLSRLSFSLPRAMRGKTRQEGEKCLFKRQDGREEGGSDVVDLLDKKKGDPPRQDRDPDNAKDLARKKKEEFDPRREGKKKKRPGHREREAEQLRKKKKTGHLAMPLPFRPLSP